MNGYEKIIGLIRKSKKNENSIMIAEMITAEKCDIGNLILEQDDYYISERLTEIDENGRRISSLKKGDVVLVYKCDDENFVILDKMVELNVSI